jgi:6-phospho-beta-glucosidase
MKVAVIGGGSTYTPELINGFLERVESFPLSELWLMDIDQERLDIVGGFAQRMVAARGAPFEVHLTTDRRAAIAGAQYVLTQLRVGTMQARREDEYLGKRHGLIGQETTGIGGMAKALRTIPVLLQIAADVRELAPGAVLVSFTNPAGLVAQAVSLHVPDVPIVGVCNGPFWAKMEIVRNLNTYRDYDIDPAQAELDVLGLNHLSWFRGLTVGGRDLWPDVLDVYVQHEPDPRWDARTVRALGMITNGYFEYFYYTDRMLAKQEHWPSSRAEQVMEIEAELLAQYAEPDRTAPPEGLMQRGGAYYSTVATQLLNTHYNDLGETHVVNVRHGGAVSGWPEDWVLEMPCRVDARGVHPLPAKPLPPVCYGLLAAVKAYELLTVEAAVTGDRQAAYQALLVHPLGPQADRVQTVLDDMLAVNKPYLPQFWAEARSTV